MNFQTRPFPGSGGRTGGTRVIDAPQGVQWKIIMGLRHIIPTEKLEEMSLQEAEALYQKTYGTAIAETELKEPTKRILRALKVNEADFGKLVNRPRQIRSSTQASSIRQPITNTSPAQKTSNESKPITKEEKFNILIINAMKKNFGITDLIRMRLNKGTPDVYQDHYLSVAKKYNEEAGLGAFMPDNILPILPNNEYSRAALQAGSMGAEAYPLHNVEDYAPVLKDLGVTILRGNKPVKNLPVLSGNTGAWLGQVAENEDASGAIAKISFSDLRYSLSQPVSKQLLMQGGPGVELLLIDQLGKGLMNGVLSTLFGVAARTTTQPQGMGWTCTASPLATATVPPGLATIDNLEGALDTAGAPVGRRAYLTNTRGARILKRAPAEVGLSGRYLMEDGKVNGWPCFISNAVSAAAGSGADGNLLIFGNWDDLVISQTGTFFIEIDPYTRVKSNLVIVTMSCFLDWKSARGSASTGEGSDANEFGVSFSACSLKQI